MHTTSAAPRFLHATAYATQRLLSPALHDQGVSVEAVVVLDAVIDHLLEQAHPLKLQVLAAETELTGQQLQDALDLLGARGYLHELTADLSAAATLRPETLSPEGLCRAA